MNSRPVTYVEYAGRVYQLSTQAFLALRAALGNGEDPMTVLADARNEYRIEWRIADGKLLPVTTRIEQRGKQNYPLPAGYDI